MTDMQTIEHLLQPVSSELACGEDLNFSSIFDEIHKARQEDDPLLEQGEWVTERKIADWGYVEKQCKELLQHRSKDLRLGFWLCEALIQTNGFAGLYQGLEIINGLISSYWLSLYPSIEDDDLDQRISLLQWFVQLMQKIPKTVSMTSQPALNFNNFEAAQILKTQLDKNPDLYDDGLPDHKITLEQYQEALLHTPLQIVEHNLQQLQQAISSWQAFKTLLDQLLGMDAPAFSAVDLVLERIADHLGKAIKERGGQSMPITTAQDQPLATHSVHAEVANSLAIPQHGFYPATQSHIQNRQQAMLVLEQISDYFSSHEPHSPVSYLLKKTIRWANMPLHEWLNQVVKQNEPLENLHEMLGIQPASDNH
ncbi:MAG: type VI secretion system protein TssA [Moraxellaceae bacterium]|nr:MAG: type VI secretion system protein TssA [Moraxellaceae bacterium]